MAFDRRRGVSMLGGVVLGLFSSIHWYVKDANIRRLLWFNTFHALSSTDNEGAFSVLLLSVLLLSDAFTPIVMCRLCYAGHTHPHLLVCFSVSIFARYHAD